MAGFTLPPNAQGLFAADADQQAKDEAANAQAAAIDQQNNTPISTDQLVANMQAAKSQAQQNLEANQIPPTAEQLAAADAQAPQVQAAVPAPSPNQAPQGQPLVVNLQDITKQSKTANTDTNPANIAQINKGAQEAKTGLEQQTQVDVAKGLQDLEIAKQSAQQELIQRAALQESENKRQAKIQAAEKASADAIDDVARTEINPNEYFQNMGIGGKITAMVGVILGGLGAGPNGPNVALDYLQKEVDRNIDAQKANLANKNASAKLKEGAYSRVLEATGHERQAQLTQQAADLGMFRRQLESTIRRPELLSQEGQARYNQAIGAIDAKYGQIKAEIQKTTQENSYIDASKDAVNKGAEKGAMSTEEGTYARQLQENAVTFDDIAKKIEKNKGDLGAVWGNLNKVKAKFGLDTKNFADLNGEQQEAVIKEAKALFKGVISENDIKTTLQILPGVTSNPDSAIRAFRRMSDEAAKKYEDFKSARGVNVRLDADTPSYAKWRNVQQQNSTGRSSKTGK